MPEPGSIITLLVPIMDERGDELPAKLDVVALEVNDDGSILVSADNAAEGSVDAWVHPGEWYQRPEEVRPTPALPVEERPGERELIDAMFTAFDGLRELGWKEAMYAPKDKPLLVIEVGSTGIHRATRDEIGFWIPDRFDTWPSSPVLFRLAEEVPDGQ